MDNLWTLVSRLLRNYCSHWVEVYTATLAAFYIGLTLMDKFLDNVKIKLLQPFSFLLYYYNFINTCWAPHLHMSPKRFAVVTISSTSLCFCAASRVQELCESRGGRPGLSVLMNLTVSVDVKQYWTMLRHWSQLVPNMSTDIIIFWADVLLSSHYMRFWWVPMAPKRCAYSAAWLLHGWPGATWNYCPFGACSAYTI